MYYSVFGNTACITYRLIYYFGCGPEKIVGVLAMYRYYVVHEKIWKRDSKTVLGAGMEKSAETRGYIEGEPIHLPYPVPHLRFIKCVTVEYRKG